jgi:hypothetical protein
MVAIVSLAAIDSDIECWSSRWTIVGTVDIAVKGEGRRVGHVLIVNLTTSLGTQPYPIPTT